MNQSSLEFFFDLAIEQKLYSTKRNLKTHLNFIFDDFDFNGKNMLDVGGGSGLLSFYASINGGYSICLEPELSGSSSSSLKKFNNLQKNLANVSGKVGYEAKSFQDYESQNKFDIIVMANSVNHLDENATIDLHENKESKEIYKKLFSKVHRLLKQNGILIITDCNRYNFFHSFGLKSPFMPTIEWQKHQSPHTWSKLLNEVGFKFQSLNWSSPNGLGRIAKILLSNPLCAFFLLSHFKIKFLK